MFFGLKKVKTEDTRSLLSSATKTSSRTKLAKQKEETESKKEKKKEEEPEQQLHYDPEDDVWALEEGKASKGRRFARSVMDALTLVISMSTFMGLFPLVPKRGKDGTYTCKFEWTSYAAILFIVAGIIIVGSTFWLLIAVVSVSTNAPVHPGRTPEISRSEEVYILKRNTVNLVIIFGSFVHLMLCMMSVFLRRDFIAKQIVYWTEVVELLQLDVGKGVASRVFRHLVILMLFVIVITSLYVLNICPLLAGSGSTLYLLFLRPFKPNCHWDPQMKIRKQIFAIFLLYVIVAGYMYILWFYYNCRILTNILKIWNNRFQYCLHRQIIESMSLQANKEVKEGAKSANRTSRAQLFQDHLVIFNLIEGVNAQFQVVIESFYLSSMVMIVFETYGFVHGLFYAEYTRCGSRRYDIIPTFLFIALQLYMYIIVTLEASGVADEARNVLHIVRRKGMMTAKLDNELWFMMSMRLSFGGHEDVGIIGGGFFYVTKSFLLGAISAVTSHFIIFYQFEVPYGQTVESDANYEFLRKGTIEKLLGQMEGVPNTPC